MTVNATDDDNSQLAMPQVAFMESIVAELAAPLPGDVNVDGVVDFLDISPFISVLPGSSFQLGKDVKEKT